jgi:hypothetical protein
VTKLTPARCSHFPPISPTGSGRFTNTIGIVRVSGWSAAVTKVVFARITSCCKSTNPLANIRVRSTLLAAQRTSIRRSRPSVQPNSASPCVNPESQPFASGSCHRTPSARRSAASALPAAPAPPSAWGQPIENRRVAALQVVGFEAVYADEDDKRLGRQANWPDQQGQDNEKVFAHGGSVALRANRTMTADGVRHAGTNGMIRQMWASAALGRRGEVNGFLA